MGQSIIYMAAFVVLIAVSIATGCMAVRRNGRGVGDLIKQLVICIAIATLLPLTSYSGATLLHPPKPMNDLMAERIRLQQDHNNVLINNNDAAALQAAQKERAKLMDKQRAVQEQIDEEERLFKRAQFWVTFPIGLASLISGLLLRSIPVSVGLAFGGLSTLIAGCYSYWDDMGDHLRFWSLLAVLAILVGVGLAKFGRSKPPLLVDFAGNTPC